MKNKACVLHAANDLRVDAVAIPEPGEGETLLRLAAGGVCGSDLHYFKHGKIGVDGIREPLVLGHEISAYVEQSPASGLAAGQLVAVNPSHTCGVCPACASGRNNLCPEVFFYGSAGKYPHDHGALQSLFLAKDSQCVPVPADTDPCKLALAEPLAVSIHAAGLAGSAIDDVLVVGCGAIGILTALAARLAGASRVACCDIRADALAAARQAGFDDVIDSVAGMPEQRRWPAVIETSGTAAGIQLAIAAARPGGRLVLVGLSAHDSQPVNWVDVVGKELEILGSFRFVDADFHRAVSALVGDEIDVEVMLANRQPLDSAPRAVARAAAYEYPQPKLMLVAG